MFAFRWVPSPSFKPIPVKPRDCMTSWWNMPDSTGTETVYDLYTGLGSIALYVARSCASIVGIEEVPAAIDDARENAR